MIRIRLDSMIMIAFSTVDTHYTLASIHFIATSICVEGEKIWL